MRFATLLIAYCALSTGASAGIVSVTVVDKEGKPVQDAVVVVSTTARGQPKVPLPMAITIDQEKMRFIPPVSLAPVGARVTFVNKDPWEHHVRGSAAGLAQFSSTGGFELRLDGKPEGKPAKTAEITADKAGPVLLGCHIHGSMRGHMYVTDSPWAQRTTPEGLAVFDDVPDGPAQVRVWQADQLIDLPLQAVTVGANPARATVQLQVVPRRRRV
ncbi:MAG: plastocyanin [Ramlibacter sp.]|nr:plastocyanin [Ramlibacter sp.]MBX3658645.1 plastocyanin [Ramlibacter sp.]